MTLAFHETWQAAKPPEALQTAGRMGLRPFFPAPCLLRRIGAVLHTDWRVWKESDIWPRDQGERQRAFAAVEE